MHNFPRLRRFVLVALVGITSALHVLSPRDASGGDVITVARPYPARFELAMDELELDWSSVPDAKSRALGLSIVLLPGTTSLRSEPARAIVGVSGTQTAEALLSVASQLEAANPGARAHLVLYKPGTERATAPRRLLTREVALILQPGANPTAVLAGLALSGVTEIPWIPGGYVLDSHDPLAALQVADALLQRDGVRTAYPLLREEMVRR